MRATDLVCGACKQALAQQLGSKGAKTGQGIAGVKMHKIIRPEPLCATASMQFGVCSCIITWSRTAEPFWQKYHTLHLITFSSVSSTAESL